MPDDERRLMKNVACSSGEQGIDLEGNAMTITPSECRVALLCGGSSGEREISLKSGEGARAALEEAGFSVEVLDPAEHDALMRLVSEPYDVAFLCLHGRGGEDGAIQGFLETIGLPYTGSGIQASALAIDKAKTKKVYEGAGIPSPAALYLASSDECDLLDIEAHVGEKAVVKPATEGSSLGVSIVSGREQLQAAIATAFDFDTLVVVEAFVEGVEVTVSVIGNESPRALPVIQMIPRNEFYDFESKYAAGGSEHLCPAPLSDELTELLQARACAAHRALGCRGVSRTDFIIDAQDEAWALETNTIPGMTATSLLPDAARAAGMSFPEVCAELVKLALA